MKIVISSSNKDKLREFTNILGSDYELITKEMLGLEDFDVVEDGKTLAENAYKKASALYEKVNKPVISDDTGLFVDVLDGAPGVFAARFAGENCSYEDNVNKMLDSLKEATEKENRTAHFKTVICFIDENGKDYYAQGILNGYISFEKTGDNGFGYDPIFIAEGSEKSLAEMTADEKNKISHRRKAIEEFKKLLRDFK